MVVNRTLIQIICKMLNMRKLVFYLNYGFIYIVHFFTMPLEITFQGKCFPASNTLKWLFTSMYSRMPFEAYSLCECFTAYITDMRFLSCVDCKMPHEIATITEWLVTCCTCVRFLPCMSPCMLLQVSSCSKELAAYQTLKWLLSSMNFYMHGKIPFLAKIHATHMAQIRFLPCMYSHMIINSFLS